MSLVHHRSKQHLCRWPGCTALVSMSMWGCSTHWFALPKSVRVAIGHTYRDGIDTGMHPTHAYIEADRAALAWIRQHEAGKAHAHQT